MARGPNSPIISYSTSDTEGTSLGESEKVWREIASTEMRLALMDNLIANKVGFNDIEMFNLGLEYNMKCKSQDQEDKERDTTVIVAAMKRKRKDEVKHRRELIKKRNRMRKDMTEEMGLNSNKYKKRMSDLNRIMKTTNDNLRQKYNQKFNHLRDKYKDDKEKRMDVVPEEMEEFRNLSVFNKERFERMKMEIPEIWGG